ncbi:MAG: GGDEF domain-containing protein [Nocardioidaceae bacterium]|nr:GGDEF domain-containing protein [Nocardioidaceae bacterium]
MVPSSTVDDALWRGLSDLGDLVRHGDDLDDLFLVAARAAMTVPGVVEAHLARIDWQRGATFGVARCDGEHPEGTATADPVGFPLADYPHAARVAFSGQGGTMSLADPALTEPERAMIQGVGGRSTYTSPLRVGPAVWGALVVGCASDEPDPMLVTQCDLVTSLLAHGLTRLEQLAALHHLAFTDPLTGIANRRAAEDVLDRYIHDPDLPGVALVLLDVDHFKQVNDSIGHDGGDQLLTLVADALTQVAARLDGGVAARLGGDEFALVARTARGLDVAEVVDAVRAAARTAVPSFDISTGSAVRGVEVPALLAGDQVRRALLRSADADLYRHKQSRRAPSAERAAEHWSEHVYDSLAELTHALLVTSAAAPDVRLRLVAEAVCAVTESATWVIGRADGDGRLRDVGYGFNPLRRSDGPTLPLDSYDLEGFPATRSALDGYPFYATIIEGDPSERRVLATTPFTAVVGAGGQDRDGVGWLVEVYADDLSGDVGWVTSTLQVLVTLALGV